MILSRLMASTLSHCARRTLQATLLAGMACLGLNTSAHAAASWSGGSGTPLSLTFDSPIDFTVTQVFDEIGPFFGLRGLPGDVPQGSTSGTLTFSLNGGAPMPMDTLDSGYGNNDTLATDYYFFGYPSLAVPHVGDKFTLNPGTLTITGSEGYTGSPPTDFLLFLFDNQGRYLSTGPAAEVVSAMTTGLPMANAEGQAIMGASQTVTNDINNHLFNLRAGGGEEDSDDSIGAATDFGVVMGEGDGNGDGAKNPIAKLVKRSRQWEAFATMNYGNVKLSPISSQAGVQVDSWASGAGIERHLSRGLTLGFALSFLQSTQNYTAGLGSVKLEGPALSAYVAYARKNVWASLLYSFGAYSMDTTRNPGFGFPQAKGDTDTYTNSVQFNTGYNFRFQNNTLVTGPFVGADYLHGSVDGYSERGGGLAALAYSRQTFQSLVTRVGWSTSKKFDAGWAQITPQFRLSYERQNLKNNGTSVSLINAPFTAAGGNQTPGQDYMVIGTGVNFQFNEQLSLLLSYQTQIFRNNLESHFGSVRLGYKF